MRARALELSHQRAEHENVEEAIEIIAGILMEEGLSEELISESINMDIIRFLRSKLMETSPHRPQSSLNALMWYHVMLLKTGSRNEWTLRRKCGATQVVAYLPLVLEALQQNITARVVLTREYLQAEKREEAVQAGMLMAGLAWTEISMLEFLHGVSKGNYEEQVSEPTVSINSGQEEEQGFRESTERDEEVDDVFVNSKNESYIIINSDIRKLYAKRPPTMESMILAQFATRYYKKHHSQMFI